MCRIAISLAARVCKAGTPKEAIFAAFRAAVSNGTSLIDELIASGAVDEATVARAIAAELGLKVAAIEEGGKPVASSLADLSWPVGARQLMVLSRENRLLRFMAPSFADIDKLKSGLLQDPDLAEGCRITTSSQLIERVRSHHEAELLENCVRRIERR